MMKTKTAFALLVNDIHVSKDNIAEFHLNWDEAMAICKQHDIEEIIVGGDLWQSRASQTLATLMAVRQALQKATSAGLYVTLANGNHDKVDQESLNGYNHVFAGYQHVDVVSDYTIIDFGDNPECTLYVMSYFPENGSFVDVYKHMLSVDFNKEHINILYIHEGIRGGLSSPSDNELPAELFKDFDAVLVGHYHDRKKIPGTKIEYIGASRQHNFGEDELKGYTILYTDGSYEFVQNKVNTRYKTINVGLDNINDALDELNEQGDNTKVRVRVSCMSTEATSVNKQQLLDAGASKIEIITEQTQVSQVAAQSLEHKYDKSGIKQEYTSFCQEKVIDPEIGLRYLDNIQ